MNRKVAVHFRKVSEMHGSYKTGQELEHTIVNFPHMYLLSPALVSALGIPQCLDVFLVEQIMSVE